MESSDESFVWSRASTGSMDSDGDIVMVKVKSEAVKQESLSGDSMELYLQRRAKEEHCDSKGSESHIQDTFKAEETVVEKRLPRTPSVTSSRSHQSSERYLQRRIKEEYCNSEGSHSESHIEAKFKAEETVVEKRLPRTPSVTSSRSHQSSECYLQRRAKEEHHDSEGSQSELHIEDKFEAEETVVEKRLPRTPSVTSSRSHQSSERYLQRRAKEEHRDSEGSQSELHIEDKFEVEETVVEKRLPRTPSVTSSRSHQSSERYLQRRAKEEHRDSEGSQSQLHIEDKFEAEETVVEKRRPRTRSTTSNRSHQSSGHDTDKRTPKKIKRSIETPNKPYTSKEYVSSDSSSSSDGKQVELKVSKQRKKLNNSKVNLQSNGHAHSERSTKVKKTKKGITENVMSVSRPSRISDRIQFEEDLNNSFDSEAPAEPLAKESGSEWRSESSLLRRYLQTHPELVPVAPPAMPSPSEELWLLRGPSDMEPMGLLEANVSLGDRCRIKLGAVSYEGRTDCSQGTAVPLLTTHNEQCVIHNFALQSSVRFRRKIPQCHVTEKNTMIYSMESVPLPETKCRHPLFGADFKKALKLPSAVRKRLKAISKAGATANTIDAADVLDQGHIEAVIVEPSHPEPPLRKKRKRARDSDGDGPKRARDSDGGVRKRARDSDGESLKRALDSDGDAPKRARDSDGGARKRARDSDGDGPKRPRPRSSAHQWDSAQDIEQNLFSY